MQYLAINQPSANWLESSSDLCKSLSENLRELVSIPQLRIGLLAYGSLRIASTQDHSLTALWNTEYLSASGLEDWGFIRLGPTLGLFGDRAIQREAFERAIHVVNQRLQGLLLDSQLIHRSHSNGAHSCLGGRGVSARNSSFAYIESNVSNATGESHTILTIGPSRDRDKVVRAVTDETSSLKKLVSTANELIATSVQRPRLDTPIAQNLELGQHNQQSAVTGSEFDSTLIPLEEAVPQDRARSTQHLTYDDWTGLQSPLTSPQRRILEDDVILRQPVRIIGAAGSGKTLVMQLLAMRRLCHAADNDEAVSLLYLTHNLAMKDSVTERFVALGAQKFLEEDSPQRIRVETLMELCLRELEVDETAVIDRDARATKLYQVETLRKCITSVFDNRWDELDGCELLKQLSESDDLKDVFAAMMSYEIGIAMKGRGLTDHRKLYVESEQAFSRLHAVLSILERDIVFDIFVQYQDILFSEYEVLDADDLALTALSRLKTPLWEMRRKREGFDYIFVDETQLFNENERRLFALLRKGTTPYVPIVLALDEAQELRGAHSSGFGLLGIEEIFDEELRTVHRCSKYILQLAFSLIQKTTDLFGTSFPDFTSETVSVVPDDHKLVRKPWLTTAPASTDAFAKHVWRQVRALRKDRLRSIAIVVHSERYWQDIVDFVKSANANVRVLTVRGEKLSPNDPIVVVTTPEYVGGQEFDAVIAVGLEQGLVPPRIQGHPGMAAALEQQALREMYLSFTRARYQLVIANSHRSANTVLLNDAFSAGLLNKA